MLRSCLPRNDRKTENISENQFYNNISYFIKDIKNAQLRENNNQVKITGKEKENFMSDIRMTAEVRTDYDCEATGMPAERWGEAVFKIGDEELVMEVSVEKDVIVAIMAGEDAVWKGTLTGLKQMLQEAIKAR